MKLVGLTKLMFGMVLLAAAVSVGCSPSQDTDKTRQQAADAAAQIKAGKQSCRG